MNPNNKEFEEEVLKYREEHGYPEYFQELYNTAAHFYKVALETIRAEVLKEMYNATRKKDIRFKSQADEDMKIIRFIDKIAKKV